MHIDHDVYSVYAQNYLDLTVVSANFDNLADAMRKAEQHTRVTGVRTAVLKHIAVVSPEADIRVETMDPVFKE